MKEIKQLNQVFPDTEHVKLTAAKKELGFKNWHDFIMTLTEPTVKEAIKKLNKTEK